jgi:uncharacterized linocin/CFP29 family protein
MSQNNPQVPWTDEQWARVNQVIQEESQRARVAASFLPLYGPLPADTDFVREQTIPPPQLPAILIEDTNAITLVTLQVRVRLRGAQLADPEMASVLTLFRRAANMLARLEDALIFNGQRAAGALPARAPNGTEVTGGQHSSGLLIKPDREAGRPWVLSGEQTADVDAANGDTLVDGLAKSVGDLEDKGYFGPFALVLAQDLFVAAHRPRSGVNVLPSDRMLPLLGGGPLLRSSLVEPRYGVVVALGGAPIELVVATDMSLQFLQVTKEPGYVFRLYEKVALRIKSKMAIAVMGPAARAQAALRHQHIKRRQITRGKRRDS